MPLCIRPQHFVAVCALGAAACAGAAYADNGPVIALSGRTGLPVVVNGIDATGAVIEGDWGLYRPGAPVTVIDAGPLLIPLLPRGAYYPATGRRPRYGRDERLPPGAGAPRPAQSYHRSWSTFVDIEPVTIRPSEPLLFGEVPLRHPRRARPSRPPRTR